MSWILAYLIAVSDNIASCLGLLTVLFGIGLIVYLFVLFIYATESHNEEERKTFWAKRKKRLIVMFIIFFFLMGTVTFFPTKKVIVTTVALKYGVDLVKTEQVIQSGENLLESVEKATKLLNEKLDQLLENTQQKAREDKCLLVLDNVVRQTSEKRYVSSGN